MKVIGPNGLVVDVPGSIATGLVGDGSRGYRYAPEKEAEEKAEAKAKPRRRRATKAVTE